MRQIGGLAIPTNLGELLEPSTTALLVYDVQIGIVRQIPDAVEVVRGVQRVLDAARRAGVRTYFTRHMSLPKKLMGACQYRTAMSWQKKDDPNAVSPWFLRDSTGFAIVPELQPTADEAIFDKITMSAFESTPLAIALRDCGIRSVVLCGIALEIGIEPTARHAVDLGIVPVIVADACGHGNADAALRTIDQLKFLGDTEFTDIATIEATWKDSAQTTAHFEELEHGNRQ